MCMSSALRPDFSHLMMRTRSPSRSSASANSASYFFWLGPRKIHKRWSLPRNSAMSSPEGWVFSKSTRMWVRVMVAVISCFSDHLLVSFRPKGGIPVLRRVRSLAFGSGSQRSRQLGMTTELRSVSDGIAGRLERLFPTYCRMPDPSAHPPSPRRQRADAVFLSRRSKPPRPARRFGYLRLHWRGELPLAATVIVSAALVWGVVQLVEFASRRVSIIDYPHAHAALWMLEVLLLLPGVVWWGTGVMRSAAHHVGRGGSASIALLSGAVGVAAFFWAAAFWWQSARHVMPDVWATLAGDAPPASVQVERVPGSGTDRAATARLLVSGD